MEAGPSEVQVSVTPGCDMTTDTEVKQLLISVKTPKVDQRVPVDIVVVLDVSGSMGMEATIQSAGGTTESHGLTLLDVAKHGVKTVISTLDQRDRVSVVTFNNGANTVFGLMEMDETGRREAIEKVDGIIQGGGTDIWQGLHGGLEALKTSHESSRVSHSHIMLLTDGESSYKDTIISKLQEYKKSEAKSLPGTINTFGFGYNLDSRLLTQMADEGLGSYSFIPDAGFVGTVFVNTMSNLMVTFGVQAMLTLDFDEDGPLVETVRGGFLSNTDDKKTIIIGSLQYEQSRDIVIDVKNLKATGESYLVANVTYCDTSGNQQAAAKACEAVATAPSADEAQFVTLHTIRSAFVENVRAAVSIAEQKRCEENLAEAFAKIKDLAGMCTQAKPEDEAFIALAEDINGQTQEAFSKLEWYWKWGRHYAPSIMFAHKLQQCNNFKDPGVQKYGGALFSEIQDLADQAFNGLPAPKPSKKVATGGYRGGAAPPSAPVSMAAYNVRYCG